MNREITIKYRVNGAMYYAEARLTDFGLELNGEYTDKGCPNKLEMQADAKHILLSGEELGHVEHPWLRMQRVFTRKEALEQFKQR